MGTDQTLDDDYPLAQKAMWLQQNFEERLTHANGKVVGRLGMTMTLYFDRQTDLEQRKNLMELVKRYREWVGEDELDWWASSMTGKMHQQRKKRFNADALWEKGRNPRLEFSIAMSSADAGDIWTDDNTKTVMEIAGNSQRFFLQVYARNHDRRLAYVRMHWPLVWSINQPPETSLGVWLKTCCELIKPVHGKLGFAISLPSETIVQSNHEYGFPIWQIVKRYPGIEAESPGYEMHKGMGPINWMTVVHDKWLDQIGGRAAVKAQCKAPVIAHEWSEGLIIQAGDEPQLGDTEAGVELPHYRTVAHLLRPLRYSDKYVNVWLREPGPESSEQVHRDSALYLSRFD